MVNVDGDGKCYFRSLSLWFEDTEDSLEVYRRAIVSRLVESRESYEYIMERGCSFQDLVRNMFGTEGYSESYSTQVEAFATSDVYNIDVFVWNPDSSTNTFSMHSFNEGEINFDCDDSRKFIAVHNKNVHYQLVACSVRPCNCEDREEEQGMGGLNIAKRIEDFIREVRRSNTHKTSLTQPVSSSLPSTFSHSYSSSTLNFHPSYSLLPLTSPKSYHHSPIPCPIFPIPSQPP